jgi:hypothetical protein
MGQGKAVQVYSRNSTIHLFCQQKLLSDWVGCFSGELSFRNSICPDIVSSCYLIHIYVS